MSANTATIKNPSISIRPSQKLIDFIKTIDVTEGVPSGISNIIFKNCVKSTNVEPVNVDYLLTSADREYIASLTSDIKNISTKQPLSSISKRCADKLLSLQDLHWIYRHIIKSKDSQNKVYLHELIEGSEIILPENQEVPRNPELEKRCKKLRAQQQNKDYHDMTKNVDNVRKKYPEDTLAYQSKLMYIIQFMYILCLLQYFHTKINTLFQFFTVVWVLLIF